MGAAGARGICRDKYDSVSYLHEAYRIAELEGREKSVTLVLPKSWWPELRDRRRKPCSEVYENYKRLLLNLT